MSQHTIAQKEFDRFSKITFNKRIGDFLYIHREANPRWHDFFDIHGNRVAHGGHGDSTDVEIRIVKDCVPMLLPRLIAYMEKLVGRHNEKLHKVGMQKFHGVMIILPCEETLTAYSGEYNCTIHTGSGCCYDQDEIAYEVMAALSGIPTLKALARESYGNFVRLDKPNDLGWIKYEFSDCKIGVELSYLDWGNPATVVVHMAHYLPQESQERFKNVMYDFMSEYLFEVTGKKMVRRSGHQRYKFNDSINFIPVYVGYRGSLYFSIDVSYSGGVPFARLEYAKGVMETLSETFKEEKIAA